MLQFIAMLVSRAMVTYSIIHTTNLVGRQRPKVFAHVLFWGGLRGSIPIALMLGLPNHPLIDKYRVTLLVAGFGVVFFSLVIQGLTMKPLLNFLKIDQIPEEEGI